MTDSAIVTAQLAAFSSLAVAGLAAASAIIVPLIRQHKSRKSEAATISLAERADARDDAQLELDGVKLDADSARAGQVSAIALIAETRTHYITLIDALDRQATHLQETIDSLLQVNRSLTISLRVAREESLQSDTDQGELIRSLEVELAATKEASAREHAALAVAETTLTDYRARLKRLEQMIKLGTKPKD